MTQSEIDARLCILNQRFDEQRFEINIEFQRRRQNVFDKLNALRDHYSKELQASQEELNKVLTERLALKRQGFEPYNPQMEATYVREREIHAANRERRGNFDAAVWSTKRELEDVQLWQQVEHKDLRKWLNDEKSRLYQERAQCQPEATNS